MKKVLLISFMFLLGNAWGDERFLIIPAHKWSDGRNYNEFIKYFKTDEWQPYTAHSQCSSYARWMHSSRIAAPMYSSCIDPSELQELRK